MESNYIKKSNFKRVSWDEKPAQKYTVNSSMAVTMNRIGVRPK